MIKTILVVEDDKRMNEIICDYLEMANFNVLVAKDGAEALEVFENNEVDLIILDIMIPKLDGWSVCRRIRKISNVLIVILSARSDEDDKLMGFDLGADEYVTKPFSPKVLVARITALFNRFEKEEDYKRIITKKEITIDKDAYKVSVLDEEIFLTGKEYELLLFLIENEGKVFKRGTLISNIWGYDYYGDGRVIDTNIKTLRKKLGNCSNYIQTIIGVGYKFEVKQ